MDGAFFNADGMRERKAFISGGRLLEVEHKLAHELVLVLGAVAPPQTDDWELMAGLQKMIRQQKRLFRLRYPETVAKVLVSGNNDAAILDEGDD